MNRASLVNSSIGEYHLLDFLGAGGMGEVYRAVHAKIGRVVAIKILTQEVSRSGYGERFLNEARIQASLHHQNIATLYDFLEVNGQPCIVMEYIDGQTLVERIAAFGSLAVEEAISVFRPLVEALDYIHSHGVVHRDIKSNNVKISSSGEVKLLDFGIAKGDSTPSFTMTGDVIGTLQYLSPEQIRGAAADARSDIWALGVLLYEMVTGHAPFEAHTLGELCEKIGKGSYPNPSMFNLGVPREVEAIISRCLRKKPAERYQSARELLEDVRRLSTAEAAPRPAPAAGGQAILSTTKRYWPAAAAGAAALLALVYFVMPSPESAPAVLPSNVAKPLVGNKPKPAPPTGVNQLKSFQIDAMEGQAEVYINGQRVGTTPYELKAAIGENIDLTLKREGFIDRREQFTVSENKRVYTFTLKKQ